MGRLFIFKIEEVIKGLLLYLDYALYLLLNFYKYKPFPKKIERILIVEHIEIGDLIVTSPVIRALKERYPNAKIDLLVQPSMKDVFAKHPDVHEILIYDKLRYMISRIRKRSYDLGVILHKGTLKTSWVLLRGGVRYRLGCTKVGIFTGKGFFLNKKIKPNTTWQHKVDDNLDVIQAIGIRPSSKQTELHTTLNAEGAISYYLKKHNMEPKKYVCIHPGANFTTKDWFPDRFAQVADHIIEKTNTPVIFTGSKKDLDLVEKIMRHMKQKENVYNAVGTTLPEFFAFIKHAKAVISVDTSAMHVAAAFDIPIVALFGSGNPKVWHPYTEKRKVVYKPQGCVTCWKSYCAKKTFECMKSITTDDVIQAYQELVP